MIKSYFLCIYETGPPITSDSEIRATTLVNESDLAVGPFGLKSPLLSTYHQQLWVIAKIETGSTDGVYICELIYNLQVNLLIMYSYLMILFVL